MSNARNHSPGRGGAPVRGWVGCVLLAGCAAGPPVEVGEFREPDLVEVVRLAPDVRLDIRYATGRNFLGRPVYSQARAFLQRPAAAALARVQAKVRADGRTLIVHDAYRPWSVTKLFWDLTPPRDRKFVADPRKGSKHNRGCAVDLTLGDAATGRAFTMPSEYDEFSDSAHPDYAGGPEEPRRRRDYLRAAMEAEGFTVYEHEWWHYDYRDWEKYRVMDVPFEGLK